MALRGGRLARRARELSGPGRGILPLSGGGGATGGRHALVVVGLALVAAACAGGDGGATPATPPVTSPQPTATGPAPATVPVERTIWFAGFEVTFVSATVAADGTVTIDATFVNTGGDTYAFDGTVVLSSGGISYEASAFETEVPSVPGGGTGEGAFAFDVEPGFSLDDATLTIGRPENQQAVVPLGPAGEVEPLEPTSLSLSGRVKAGEVVVELSAGELRADLPETHSQAEAGKLFLTLTFDVSYVGDFPGGYPFGYANSLALELPDGTTIAADDGPIELLAPGTTLPDQLVRFTVDDPAAGAYSLILTDTERDRRNDLGFEIP